MRAQRDPAEAFTHHPGRSGQDLAAHARAVGPKKRARRVRESSAAVGDGRQLAVRRRRCDKMIYGVINRCAGF